MECMRELAELDRQFEASQSADLQQRGLGGLRSFQLDELGRVVPPQVRDLWSDQWA